ncbi:MAG: hypothetical protein KBE41_08090 [Lutibacter sp.]|nr:hypothetical protein [Lutibacter sp.]
MNSFRIKNLRFRILKGGKIGLAASLMMFGVILQSSLSANALTIDGDGDSGIFVGSAGGTYSDTIFTNFFTEGGAGSGGGAGLGGVFFVDKGATLNLTNTVFAFNTAKGGEGGSLPAQLIGDTVININQLSLGLTGFEQQSITPTLTYDSATSKYSFDTINVATGTKLLNSGSGVTFGELGSSSTIASKTDTSITLGTAVVIDNAKVTSITKTNVADGTGYTSNVVDGKTVITFDYIKTDGTTQDTTLIAQVKDNIKFNGLIAVNNGTISDNATIEKVNYDTNGNILSVELSKALSVTESTLDLISLTKFETKPYVVSGNTITITGETRGFKEGMVIYDKDGASTGAKITAVSSDGKTLTVDNAAGLANVGSITAKSTPFLSNTEIKLSTPNPDIKVGGTITINGDEHTVGGYDSTTGVVTLNTAIDSDIKTAIENDGELLTLKVNTVSVDNGAKTITLSDKGQEFTVGMKIKDTDLEITNVSKTGDKITITVAGDDDLDELDTTRILAVDPLTTGGSMNNLAATGTAGANGKNGKNANYYSSFFEGGEGQDGNNGYSGKDGTGAAGGNAGDGGNGSDGLAVNPQLISELWGATGDFTDAIDDLATALVPEGIPIPTPEFADIPGAIIGVATASVDLATAIANTVFWAQNLNEGLAGKGGAGGDGGSGGSGDEFFGGGAGGAGGAGGEGALSFTDAGAGGEGGLGGKGGFGAGGGSGGAGGDAGSTGAADGGDPGDGGKAGFGAGDGSNGDGLYGNGGSGFGGAIFVREGGTLNITGNALFENNSVDAGSSNNEGEQGESAGEAIFMMKGSTVNLMPGSGNKITFNEAIGDNSGATYDSASYAAGAGASIHIAGNGGLVEFNAENTYSGRTILEGATLKAALSEGINDKSQIVFAGTGAVTPTSDTLALGSVGTLLLDEDLTTRRVGARSIDAVWEGSGGFASGTEDGIKINFGQLPNGTGQDLTWGTNGFFQNHTDSALTFGSEQSLGAVDFANNVTIGTGKTATVAVYNTGNSDNADSSSAILSGNWKGDTLVVGSSTYNGTLVMNGQNELKNLTIIDGNTVTSDGGTISNATTNTNVKMYGGKLVLENNETLNSVSIESGALFSANENLVVNNGIMNKGTLILNRGTFDDNIVNDSNFANGGNITVDANITNNHVFSQIGEVQAINIINSADANWSNQADVNLSGALTNDGTWKTGQQQVINEFTSWKAYADSTKNTITLATLIGTGIFDIDNGDLAINQSQNSTFDGDITGQGMFEKSGVGELTVTKAQNFGKLNISKGKYISNGAHTLASALVGTGAQLDLSANLTTANDFTNSGTLALNADITTGTNFVNNGATTVTENRTITTTGGLAGATSGTINTSADKTLTLNQTGDSTYSGSIEGNGSFLKKGAGTLTLNGAANSVNLGNQLIIDGGTLALDGAGILASTMSVAVNDYGTMNLISGNQNITSLSGAGIINLGVNKLYVNNGGTFAGIINGSGTLDIVQGDFNISNNITSDNGTLNVSQGTTTIATIATVIIPDINVNNGGTLDVAGAVEASNVNVNIGTLNVTGTVEASNVNVNNGTLDVAGTVEASKEVVVQNGGTLHLGNATDNVTGTITTAMTSLYGTLNGIGSISGTTTAHNGSYLKPGNSPGSITFMDLILAGGSTSEMEIETSATAGVTFDQITVNNNFTIDNEAKLNLLKYGAGTELAQGEKVKIFNFTPGNIKGFFGDVTSTYNNDVILNLQTGEVVGLGGTTISQFENSVASNSNQINILNDLKMNETNGVAQYYGGELASRLASNQGNAVETKKIFETFSPEAYSSLLEQNKFNLINSTSKLPTDLENTKTGLSISMDRNTYETKEDVNSIGYNIEGNEIKIDHTGKFYEGFIVTSINAIDGEIDSKYMSATTKNYGINIAMVQPLGSENLTFRSQASYMKGDTDLSRETYDSKSYANSISSSGIMAGLGLGYDKKFENVKLATTLDVLYYKSNVDGFTESNANVLDALTVQEQDESGLVSKAKVKVTKDLTENLSISGKAEYTKFFNSDKNKVSANVTLEDTLFSVENEGLGKDIIGLGVGVDYKVNKEWSAEFNAGISGDKDLTQNNNIGFQLKYAF